MAGLNAGVETDPTALAAFQLVKTKKKDFVLFEVNPAKTHVVCAGIFPDEKNAEDLAAYESDVKEKKQEANFASRVFPKFKAALVGRGAKPCYAVLDLRYVADERAQDKMMFFFWCPDSVGVRDKMLGASTYQSFSGKLGVAAKMQLQDASDIDLAAIIAKAK